MQQAECADSIRDRISIDGKRYRIIPDEELIPQHPAASPGKRRAISGDITFGPVGRALEQTHYDLSEIRTILGALMEVCDEATDEKGIYYRHAGWEQGRFMQAKALAGIAFDMTERIDTQATKAWDGLVAYEAAA